MAGACFLIEDVSRLLSMLVSSNHYRTHPAGYSSISDWRGALTGRHVKLRHAGSCASIRSLGGRDCMRFIERGRRAAAMVVAACLIGGAAGWPSRSPAVGALAVGLPADLGQ